MKGMIRDDELRGNFVRNFLRCLLVCAAMTGITATAETLRLEGALQQGALIIGTVAPGTKVLLNGKSVRVTPEGRFVIGFDRDAKATAKLTAIHTDGRKETRALTIARREYDVQSVTGVPQQTVEPPPSVLARIEREARLVTAARAVDSDLLSFLDGFQWPLTGRISGIYGSQRIYNGKPGRPHYGVDVAAPVGRRVRAPADAVVTLAEPDLFFSGGTLIMDHGFGVSSTFMHLSRLLVKKGDRVRVGEEVAEVGATGRASGPHLDWRINWFNVRLDPQLIAPPMPTSGPIAATPDH